MTHNAKAKVRVTNNFGYPADITVNHVYSTSNAEIGTWSDVKSGQTSDSADDMDVTYSTGATHWGKDKWTVQVVIKGGPLPGQYISGITQTTLHNADRDSVVSIIVGATGVKIVSVSNSGNVGWITHP